MCNGIQIHLNNFQTDQKHLTDKSETFDECESMI